ncbi:MAG: hypothetical protein AAGB34_03975 [Planctomycetota bacterium]
MASDLEASAERGRIHTDRDAGVGAGGGVNEEASERLTVEVRSSAVMIRNGSVRTMGSTGVVRSGSREWVGRRVVTTSAEELSSTIDVSQAQIVEVPESVDDDQAAMVGVVAIAFAAVYRAEVDRGGYIAVVGDDAVSLASVQLGAVRNDKVRLISRGESAGERAARWGLKHRLVSEAGKRGDQRAVVLGDASMFGDAARMASDRATIVLIDGMGTIDGELLQIVTERELTLRGVGTGPVSEAMAMIEMGGIDLAGLVGMRHQTADALQDQRDGEITRLLQSAEGLVGLVRSP